MLGKLNQILREKLGLNQLIEKTEKMMDLVIHIEKNICHQIDINRHEIRRISGFLLNDLIQEHDQKGVSFGLGLDHWKLRELEGLLLSLIHI